MKKQLARCLLLSEIVLMFGYANAYTWKDKKTGYTWTFRINGNGAEIYGEEFYDSLTGLNFHHQAVSPWPDGALAIPTTLGGKPVTSIGEYALNSCSQLTEVSIPSSVTNIGESAFSGDNGLVSIVIPAGVKGIGGSAFARCTGLNGLVIPPSVETIGEYAFCNCSGLESVVIPEGVRIIDKFAFCNCTNLTSVVIPSSTTRIGDSAFGGCTRLSSVFMCSNSRPYIHYPYESFRGGDAPDAPKGQLVTYVPDTWNESALNYEYWSFWPGTYNIERVNDLLPLVKYWIVNGANRTLSGSTTLQYASLGVDENVTVLVDNSVLLSATNRSNFTWQPQTTGRHVLKHISSGLTLVCTQNVTKLSFFVQPSSNPPMGKNNNISITPTTRNFGVNGGGNAIITSGSGTWTAVVSDPWITLNATSGTAGYPVAYTVNATTNVEQRVGYVYVSGWTHTITQDGHGATITRNGSSNDSVSVDNNGGKGTIYVHAANKMVWQARPNVDWLSVSPTRGAGEGSVTYQVAPYNEVATRQGTLTVAGNTFTVFQYGRRMKLDSYSATKDYVAHVIPITVNALAITQWSVTPNNSWISVVDAGNGQGGDLVSIAIAENPSYKARTGTVTIGTETFTITQQGRPTAALAFSVNPTASTASVEGANGMIAVTATPDLPWAATSGANWLTIYAATANGAGNGNVVYSASPNPTLSKRTGKITITPEKASGMAAKTHTVTQPAAVAALSSKGYEFEAAGESCSVDVSVANIVQWSVSESIDWITVNGSTSRTGPGTVVIQAAANDTVYPRSGTVTIAGKTFSVSQKARGVELEYDTKLFGTDGGSESISIHPDGNVSWTAVASDATWITIFQGDSGTGDGEILYIVAPYVGNGAARTGWITVGDKKVYITQRAYDLNIEPNGSLVTGNNGAGEFGVSAGINDVWNAIVTEPWITIVSGYDAGTGSGTVRFIYTENNTGKTRTGKIIVAGEVYTLEQRARQMVSVMATAGCGGKVSGGGSYDLGSEVTLTAVPNDGYKFSYWTGDVESMQNPIKVTVDVAKSVTAVFEPLPIAFESVTSGTDGVRLSWNNLAWATTYRIYRGVTSVPSSAIVLTEIVNTGNCTYLDESGVIGTTYWYWIEAEGAEDSVMSDPMTGMKQKPIVISPITYQNLRGATHTNPESYQEGTLVSFTNPSGVTGYTFAGWTPSQITTDMTGAQTVRASWTANSYTISYNANGGSGTMDGTSATYDSEATVAENGFTWTGHEFKGWATEPGGAVVYAPGQPVTNLTAQSGGVVTLYAVWADLVVPAPVVTPSDGTVFTGDSCEVCISCGIKDAIIYYSTNGSTPKESAKAMYNGPFVVTDSVNIKAVAVFDGVKSSYVTAAITKKSLTLAEAAGDPNLTFTTGGDVEWIPNGDHSASTGYSVRSGTISDDETSWIEVVVNGAGTLAFQSKSSCEFDPDGTCTWDHLEVIVDDEDEMIDLRIDGNTPWTRKEIQFTSSGSHTICWVYVKDESGSDGEDCVWLSGVTWMPAAVSDPIPELSAAATSAEVVAALEGSADAKLAANIATAAEYAAYRAWALGLSGVTPDAVKDSAYAWLSFALDADALIAAAPKEGDLKIGGFTQGSSAGVFDLSVSISGIAVGDNATAENLAKVFGIEGAGSLDESEFKDEDVDIEFGKPEGGKVKIKATPKDPAAKQFFMRVKMKQ